MSTHYKYIYGQQVLYITGGTCLAWVVKVIKRMQYEDSWIHMSYNI